MIVLRLSFHHAVCNGTRTVLHEPKSWGEFNIKKKSIRCTGYGIIYYGQLIKES